MVRHNRKYGSIHEVQNLSGAVYEVYAAEDIYTADFQKDDTGKRILKYAKGEKVAELTTDESGKAELDNLPLRTPEMFREPKWKMNRQWAR